MSEEGGAAMTRVALYLIVMIISVGLTGCPTPIPTCREYSFAKPSINIKEPLMTMETMPEGTALVFGQINLEGPKEEGIVSTRLVSYKNYLSGKQPYGEKEVRLEPNGKFQWILPLGHYVIQPIYFNYDYRGVGYHSSKQINISLPFEVSEAEKVYYLGTVNIFLSSELNLRDTRISNDLTSARSQLPDWVNTGSNQLDVNLVRNDLDLGIVNVARRKTCRKWNIISWCIIAPYGACFNVDE
ncbi:MAG: hypothetical protein V3T19_02040 [Acidiferrobacterales bacterium]